MKNVLGFVSMLAITLALSPAATASDVCHLLPKAQVREKFKESQALIDELASALGQVARLLDKEDASKAEHDRAITYYAASLWLTGSELNSKNGMRNAAQIIQDRKHVFRLLKLFREDSKLWLLGAPNLSKLAARFDAASLPIIAHYNCIYLKGINASAKPDAKQAVGQLNLVAPKLPEASVKVAKSVPVPVTEKNESVDAGASSDASDSSGAPGYDAAAANIAQ